MITKTVEAHNIVNRRRIGIRRGDLLQLQVWQYSSNSSNCSFPPSHYQGIDWTNAKMPKSTEEKEATQTERTLFILNYRQGFKCDKSRPCQESDNERIKWNLPLVLVCVFWGNNKLYTVYFWSAKFHCAKSRRRRLTRKEKKNNDTHARNVT